MEESFNVKSLGMGDAYLNHSEGHDSIFFNPANLSSMTGFKWRILGMSLGLNGLNVYNDYADILNSGSNNLSSTLNSLYGKPIWARLDLQTTMSFGSLLVGGFGRSNLGFNLVNPALPNLETSYFADYGLMAGWGTEVIPSFMDLGFLVKRVTRYAGGVTVGASSIAYLDSSVLEDAVKRSGTGYSGSMGAKFKFPGEWHPMMSFAWQDIGDTSYGLYTTNAPYSTKDQMGVGLGFEKDFILFKLKPELEVRHINESDSDMQIGKKMHMGLELDFPGFELRGGLNQGYYTAGASFDFWLFQVDMATYGVELGEYPGQLEDRRYVVQLTMDFGFDPSGKWFNFSQERKQARRGTLKERR